MLWLIFALISATLNALMDFFVKLSSNKINDGLGGVLLTASATVAMLIPVIVGKMRGEELLITKQGAFFSILAGLSVGMATFFIFKMFSTRVEMSVAVPTMRIAIIVVATLLGIFFFHEKISARLLIGFLCALSGVYLIITSPR